MNILGVRIDNFSKKEILEKIEYFLDEDKFHQIATVNPEFILQAQLNQEFKKNLNRSDLDIADGIGLKYAFIRYGRWLKSRIAGADLMHEIFNLAEKKGLSVFLAINKNGLSSYEEIVFALNIIYPKLKISGCDIDPFSHQSSVISQLDYRLLMADCKILFCNFGAPYQEKFINSVKNDTIRLTMGVGGSFDFLTEKVKRAPKSMRFIGLEWLFRLYQEPRYRIKRIFNATVVFPYKIIFSKKQYD